MAASVATIDYMMRETISGHSLQAEVLSAPARGDELLVSQRPAWLDTAAARLLSLMALEQNWDSYGGRPLLLATANQAFQLLARLCDLGLPAPRLVPTAPGGVQFEWDLERVELELELEPGGGMVAIFDDADRGESWERELPQSDLVPIEGALRRLAAIGPRR